MTHPRPPFRPTRKSATARVDTLDRRSLRLLALGTLGIALIAAQGLRAQEAATGEQPPAAAAEADGAALVTSHGYNYFGELKYPADFDHFDYVNPDAPKGGSISISALGTFDSLNPYSRKGRAGAMSSMMYESLLDTTSPADEYGSLYCLLCESVEYDAGMTYVIFHMRPDARFSDGTPVTAEDVVFSHNLFLEQGLPSYAVAVKKRIIDAQALDEHTVRFDFATDIPRRSLIDQAGAVPVFSKKWYDENGARLDESRMTTSPGSGPYMLDSYEVNRRIVYKRNPDYWGNDLPVNRGRHNFDEIRVEYFADEGSAFEAFKVGEYTFNEETSSRQWATQYDFPAVAAGSVVKEELPDGSPPTNTGFVFNLGRDVVKDKLVRQAMALAFNFEWTNESLQYGLMSKRDSFIEGTDLEATGVPEGAELAFLDGLGDVVPEDFKTAPAVVAHDSDAARLNDRGNLRKAMGLLDEAGWTPGPDGIRQKDGKTLQIEIPYSSSSPATIESVMETWAQNLQVIGVKAVLQKVDPAQYTDRERNRDYDVVYDYYRTFQGAGTGLMQMFGSGEAEFSLFNPAGLASPLVDTIIEASLNTETQEDQDVAIRALDRALRYEFFMVPTWYKAEHWVAYWDQYDHPAEIAPYDLGYLDYWWYDEAKAEALRASGALR